MPNKSYLTFRLISSTDRTHIWEIDSASGGDKLGEIRWYSPWRRYCFFTTQTPCVFDLGCLNEIARFIDRAMTSRKSGLTIIRSSDTVSNEVDLTSREGANT